MSKFAFDSSARGYSAVNACALAQLSSLAYSSKAAIRNKLRSWGFDTDTFEFIDVSDTQAFVISRQDCTIVAFRGTEPTLADWLSDIQIHLTGGPLGRVHEGFASALNHVWLDVFQALDDLRSSERTVWLTGHSLGAALATLAVAKLIERGEPVDGLYTYGSPRCGDEDFSGGFQSQFTRAYRVINSDDIVTRVPPRPAYHHVGTAKLIDANGVLRDEEDGWLPFLRSGKFSIDSLLKLDPKKAFLDHNIDRYVEALEKLCPPANT